jgi:hypothetical protein
MDCDEAIPPTPARCALSRPRYERRSTNAPQRDRYVVFIMRAGAADPGRPSTPPTRQRRCPVCSLTSARRLRRRRRDDDGVFRSVKCARARLSSCRSPLQFVVACVTPVCRFIGDEATLHDGGGGSDDGDGGGGGGGDGDDGDGDDVHVDISTIKT